jgi:hypothetical protein
MKAFPYLYSLALQEAEGRPIDYKEAVEYAETIAFQSHLSGFGQWINKIIKTVPVLGWFAQGAPPASGWRSKRQFPRLRYNSLGPSRRAK